MALPLLIKPIIKALTKATTKAITKNMSSKTIAGIQTAQKYKNLISNLTSGDIVNITRAKFDKRIAGAVAKSLKIPVRDLNKITNLITDSKARREAVKGRNFMREVERHTGIKSNIKDYIKRLKGVETNKSVGDNQLFSQLEELNELIREKTGQNHGLPHELLKGGLKFNLDTVEDIINQLNEDTYYNVDGQDIFLNYDDTGDYEPMYPLEYLAMVVTQLKTGSSFTPHGDII